MDDDLLAARVPDDVVGERGRKAEQAGIGVRRAEEGGRLVGYTGRVRQPQLEQLEEVRGHPAGQRRPVEPDHVEVVEALVAHAEAEVAVAPDGLELRSEGRERRL